jgi:hypothetical protein
VTLTVVLGSTIGFMMLAAWMEWPWWEYAFLSDGSPVAWLSSALLVANAAVALNVTVAGAVRKPLGAFLAAGLGSLAIDEQFQIHERIKETAGPGFIGNLPILMTGVVGAVAVVLLTRSLRGRLAPMLLQASLGVAAFALLVDLVPISGVVGRLEEGYEVIAESLFLCGLIEGSRVTYSRTPD